MMSRRRASKNSSSTFRAVVLLMLFNPSREVKMSALVGDLVALVSIERTFAFEDQVLQTLERTFPSGSPTGVLA